MRKNTLLYGALITLFLVSSSIMALAADPAGDVTPTESSSAGIFLYTGSPLILSNGEVEMLDAENPDIAATVVESKTLLPLRAIAEYFGAEVTYDQQARQAVIQYEGKQYLFPIGEKKYIAVEGTASKEYTMDSKAQIIDGRTMVPLRVICENILGRTVSYYDRVIAVSDAEINLEANAGLMEEVKLKIGEAVKARTMKELTRILLADSGVRMYTTEEAAPDALPATNDSKSQETSAADAGTGSSSFSTTNVQVEGIDEADVVKTDGKYIYIGGNNVVRIVGANNGELTDDTAIRLATEKNVNEIYVADGKLVILGTKWSNNYMYRDGQEGISYDSSMNIMPPYYSQKSYSFVDVYDITDPLKPVYLKGHEMEGSYQSSRKNGEIVYLVTNTYPSGGIYLPMMKDTTIGNEEFSLTLDDVMIMPRHPSSGYLIISAINVTNDEKTEVEAITAYGATMYMNDSAMYLAVNNSYDATSIIKFELEGMKVGYAGSGEVDGYLLNQFSMDEYEGNLRVATTTWESENQLNILDKSLNTIGSVTGLAKGESIYSVRFMGDKGYIVTFRNMDPLFVFDLSDPKNPVLTGELTMPGFSNYLHPVGENLILGIGADTYNIYRKDSTGAEVIIGTQQGGIKFSLFDISDMGNPKEVSKYVIGDAGSSSEAFYNHRAIMVDEAAGNVAIDAYLNFDLQTNQSRQAAVIINFNNNKLSLKGTLDSEPSGVYGNDIPYARRIIYIGDELYYVQDGRISSYHYDNLKQIDTLVLQ